MSCACNLRRCHTGRLNISLRTRRWELREEKKRICLILQSDSSQQISQSQCHSIMNSPPVLQAFCCHAAACVLFSTTECEMCFELQQGVRVSTSFSLLLSLSLSASCQVIGTIFPLFLSSIPSLHLPPPTKPVTPPPHHTLFTRTSASTLCRVRAGDEGGSGRF